MKGFFLGLCLHGLQRLLLRRLLGRPVQRSVLDDKELGLLRVLEIPDTEREKDKRKTRKGWEEKEVKGKRRQNKKTTKGEGEEGGRKKKCAFLFFFFLVCVFPRTWSRRRPDCLELNLPGKVGVCVTRRETQATTAQTEQMLYLLAVFELSDLQLVVFRVEAHHFLFLCVKNNGVGKHELFFWEVVGRTRLALLEEKYLHVAEGLLQLADLRLALRKGPFEPVRFAVPQAALLDLKKTESMRQSRCTTKARDVERCCCFRPWPTSLGARPPAPQSFAGKTRAAPATAARS
jgi:hypothetical protein